LPDNIKSGADIIVTVRGFNLIFGVGMGAGLNGQIASCRLLLLLFTLYASPFTIPHGAAIVSVANEAGGIGLVAGRGRYPMLFAEETRRLGIGPLVVVAMHGETDPALAALADQVEWVYVGQLDKTIKAFLKAGVRRVVFAGQIKPGRLFGDLRPDFRVAKLLAFLRERNAESIFGALTREFEKDGVTILPATTHLEAHLASPGVLGRVKPSSADWQDIELGRRIAITTSSNDIGQTVVVKAGAILAVEAFEGTDKAIIRGGEVGKGDVIVVKVAKPRQDLRFDVPCIGLRTVESLITAKARVLAVETGRTLLLDRPAVLAALDQAKIAVVGIPLEGPVKP
jgi:UDP-2,3-diacylglucosamine hydrolase